MLLWSLPCGKHWNMFTQGTRLNTSLTKTYTCCIQSYQSSLLVRNNDMRILSRWFLLIYTTATWFPMKRQTTDFIFMYSELLLICDYLYHICPMRAASLPFFASCRISYRYFGLAHATLTLMCRDAIADAARKHKCFFAKNWLFVSGGLLQLPLQFCGCGASLGALTGAPKSFFTFVHALIFSGWCEELLTGWGGRNTAEERILILICFGAWAIKMCLDQPWNGALALAQDALG